MIVLLIYSFALLSLKPEGFAIAPPLIFLLKKN